MRDITVATESFCRRRTSIQADSAGSGCPQEKNKMKRSLVRYQTKPEKAEENERLIKGVFEELHAKSPDGVGYLVLKLADGHFFHFVSVDSDASAITALPAFKTFQGGVKDRVMKPPESGEVTIVGNYRMLGES
jgi:hypothetical protein